MKPFLLIFGFTILACVLVTTSRKQNSSRPAKDHSEIAIVPTSVGRAISATRQKPQSFVESADFISGMKNVSPDSDEFENELQNLVSQVDARQFPEVLNRIQKEFPCAIGDQLTLRLIRHWADLDASAAADWVAKMPSGNERTEALNTVAIAWANQDPEAATAWVRQTAEGAELEQGLTSVAYEQARTQPVEALTRALTLPDNDSRNSLITYAAAQWAASNPEDASQWSEQISDPRLQQRVLEAVAVAWASRDPAAAGTFATRFLSPGRLQDDAIMSIVERWTQRDSAAAAQWVALFPPGPLRASAEEFILNRQIQ